MSYVREEHIYYYVYLLKSLKTGRFYTGYTNDLRKRFKEHNNNLSPYTSKQTSYELIYYEACRHKYDAIAREKYLKSVIGKRYLKNRLKRFLFLT